MISCPRLTVAALRGGSGKTTVSLGLVSAWREQGLHVIPFKKGPDYIDAGWLAQAAETACYNLDPFLMSRDQLVRSFAYRSTAQGADLSVIEGNRGLYDGTDEEGAYSTAELAKLLGSPVVLVVDCTKVTRTLAAVVYGCQKFDPDLNLAGVILNEVATSRQEALVRNTIESATGLPVLGAVPRVRSHDLPERHLGLVPHQEHPTARKVLALLRDMAAKYLDLDRLRELAGTAPPLLEVPESPWTGETPRTRGPVRIGVIRDSAFQFYYPENLEALERLGAETVSCSSLDSCLLPEVDALYLGGGFPETHAEVLAANTGLRTAIKAAAEKGLPIYAECGGLMYLGRSLILGDNTYPMADVLPVVFGLEKKPQGHGYTKVSVDRANPFYPVGQQLVGHEFHYSKPLDYPADQVNLVFKVDRGHGFHQGRDGLTVHNVFATYTHLHALGTTLWAESLVDLAVSYRKKTVVDGETHGNQG